MYQRRMCWITACLCALTVLTCALSACKKPPTAGDDPPPDSVGCSPSASVVQGWAADDFPFPTEVGNEPNPESCDFYQFAWQEFIQLLKQDASTGGNPVFLTWPDDTVLFPETGAPPPWSTQPRKALGRGLNKSAYRGAVDGRLALLHAGLHGSRRPGSM